MELRVARAIHAAKEANAPRSIRISWERADAESRCYSLAYARAAIRAMLPNIETMDGGTMNAMCAAFGWPADAGSFPGEGGLTAACTRAVVAYLDAASPPRA